MHKSGLDSEEPWQGKWESNVTVDCIEGVLNGREIGTQADVVLQISDINTSSGTGVIKKNLILWSFPLLYLAQCVRIV